MYITNIRIKRFRQLLKMSNIVFSLKPQLALNEMPKKENKRKTRKPVYALLLSQIPKFKNRILMNEAFSRFRPEIEYERCVSIQDIIKKNCYLQIQNFNKASNTNAKK